MDEMPGMIRPDLQALPQHFQLAEKVEHRALPFCIWNTAPLADRTAQSPLQTKKGSFKSRRRASRCCCWGRVHG